MNDGKSSTQAILKSCLGRVVQLEHAPARCVPQAAERLADHVFLVGDEQQQVAGLGAEPLPQLPAGPAAGRNFSMATVNFSASTLIQASPLAP